MNIMNKRGTQDNIVTYEHYCDTKADLANIPKNQITLGSVAIVLKDDDDSMGIYMANSNKEWISFSSGGSGMNDDVGGEDNYYKLLAKTIEDVVIPDGITAIPEFMFANCTKIKSITIPDSVTIINGNAFGGAGWENGGVMFPLIANSVEEVHTSRVGTRTAGAFYGVQRINKLVLPAIKTIDDSAFGGCIGLEYIYLGPNCTSIGSGAFGGVFINCKVECGFAEGAISGFPNNAGFAGNPADLDITYNVPAPTVEY